MGSLKEIDLGASVDLPVVEFTKIPDIDLYRRSADDSRMKRVEIETNWNAQVDRLSRAYADVQRTTIALSVFAVYFCRIAEDRESTFEIATNLAIHSAGLGGLIQIAINGRESFSSFMERIAVQQMNSLALTGRNQPYNRQDHPHVLVTMGKKAKEPQKADLHLHIDDNGYLECWLPSYVGKNFGERLLQRLTATAKSIAEDRFRALVSHEIMPVIESQTVLSVWNDTDIEYGYDGGLVAMMQRAASRNPDHPAIIYKGEAVSYREFNSRVNRLARRLINKGVTKDSFVCLCMERSIEMVVAIWAVIKAGGAYVPLNTEDPIARIAEIVEDCDPKVVLAQPGTRDRVPPIAEVMVLDEGAANTVGEEDHDLDFLPDPDALAYMIYTSGSTGKPKGVTVEHEAIHNRVVWMHREYGLEPADRVLQKTPYTFDVSVWEFLWSFAVGSTLVVTEPGGHMAMRYMYDLMMEQNVTHLHFVPSVLRLFLMLPELDKLPIKKLFCSGEALGFDSVETFYNKANETAEVHNLYGPTEAAVDVSYFHCPRNTTDTIIPIGKPVANTGLYVLDEFDQPCPIGIPGELHIGGVQLARGYWAREDLTSQRFVTCNHQGVKHSRLYKTGDLAFYREDGEIVYLGRNDFQVKINGVRMELGEIEAVIRTDNDIKDVVVVAENAGGNKVLIAYVVSDNPGEEAGEALKALVADSRPPYYVPREVRFLNEMPLTVSGKINRKLLADAPRAA